ncbi:hypothetical protein JCM33374_g5153 [Metschnikowia sp. JCM 33374]|nr:hypothetical protein JCM33374_g5153 [Metschnikowia sp. JCM 33374]
MHKTLVFKILSLGLSLVIAKGPHPMEYNEEVFVGTRLECTGQERRLQTSSGDVFCIKESDVKDRFLDHQIQETNQVLDDFVKRLKTYMYETTFHVRAFESKGAELGRRLEDISIIVTRFGPQTYAIISRLNFAKEMFEKMSTSIDPLKFYESITLPGHELVWGIIDLNIRLLELRNSQGSPDSSIKDYQKKITSFTEFISNLSIEVARTNMTFGMHSVFMSQKRQAEKTLLELAFYI